MANEVKEESTSEVRAEETKPLESKPVEGKTEEAPAEKGLTESLFGDDFSEPRGEVVATESKADGVPATAEGKEEVPLPKADGSEEAQMIDLESFGDSLIKTNVGGVETDVKFKDLVRSYQTDSYLTQKGQRLAEKEKELNSKAKAFVATPSESKLETENAEELSEEDKWVMSKFAPELEKRDKVIEDLQQRLMGIQEATRDVAYESMLVRADKTVKAKKIRGDGSPIFDDFRSFVPKIETFIASLPEDQQHHMLNDMGYISVYNEMKMDDLISGKQAPKKTSEVRAKPNLRKIPVVESGTGTSTGAAGENASYEKAFDKATKSGRTEDWMSVMADRFGD